MSNKLQEAREYEEKYEKQIGMQDRPAFHLSTRVGWMNDPNGFSSSIRLIKWILAGNWVLGYYSICISELFIYFEGK